MKLELEEIYKTYFQDVYYFVLAMSKDPHIAEEITQETFFKALKGVKHFQENAASNPGCVRLPGMNTFLIPEKTPYRSGTDRTGIQ